MPNAHSHSHYESQLKLMGKVVFLYSHKVSQYNCRANKGFWIVLLRCINLPTVFIPKARLLVWISFHFRTAESLTGTGTCTRIDAIDRNIPAKNPKFIKLILFFSWDCQEGFLFIFMEISEACSVEAHVNLGCKV